VGIVKVDFFYIYTTMDSLTVLNNKLKDANAPFTIIVWNKRKKRYTLKCVGYQWHTTTRHEDNVFSRPIGPDGPSQDVNAFKINPDGMYCKMCSYPKVALTRNQADYDKYVKRKFGGSRVDDEDNAFPSDCKGTVLLKCRVEDHGTFLSSPIYTGFRYNAKKPGKTKEMSRYDWCGQCKAARAPWALDMLPYIIDSDAMPQRSSHGRVEVYHWGCWVVKCRTPDCPYQGDTSNRKPKKYLGLCMLCLEYA
jgi:hypothetical protein